MSARRYSSMRSDDFRAFREDFDRGFSLGQLVGRGVAVFLICPVRGAPGDTEERDVHRRVAGYVAGLQRAKVCVHYPPRDTQQQDAAGGINICRENIQAMRTADEVHVWWDAGSEGSKFDLGAAMALRKKVRLANPADVTLPDAPKSFTHVVMALDEEAKDHDALLAQERERRERAQRAAELEGRGGLAGE